MYPTQAQVGEQVAASIPQTAILKAQSSTQNSVQFSVELPKWGAAHLQVQI
jgi:hypothetical protein